MMIAKDDPIVALLAQLDRQQRGWAIRDHWEVDLCAIGISSQSSPRKLVYVSTFGKPTGKYDYECEKLRLGVENEADYDTVSEGCDVAFPELVDVMHRHLDSTT
jgi:hypothetical protein